MSKSHWVALASAGLALLSAAPPASAQAPLVAGSIPPYVYEAGGQARGVLADLVNELARRIGRSGKIEFFPWARAQQTAATPRDHKPRLILPLTRTAEREDHFNWIVLLLSDDALLVTRKNHRPADTVEGAKTRHVGALMGSPLEAQLHTLEFTHVDAGVDEETNAKKLAADRLDVWFVASMVAPFVYGRVGFDPGDLVYGMKLRTNDLWLAATPGLPKAESDAWIQALAAAKADGTYDRIIKRQLQAQAR